MSTPVSEAREELVPRLFDPRSIAVVGASSDPVKAAGRTLRYLQRYGFAGPIYPINPARTEVQGLPCYPSLEALPEVPDLAVIVLPSTAVVEAVERCAVAGVAVAVVFASGFSETGEEGRLLEEQLARVTREHPIRVVGPNCNGVIGVASGATTTFMSGIDDPDLTLRDDGVAFVSQSGAMGAFILTEAQYSALGVGRFVSTGNEVDVSLAEVVGALAEDPATRVVLGYVEGVREPGRFRDALATAQRRGVPVCLMKVGRSAAGAEAAASHTGALAGEDVVFDGLLTQHGVIRAHSVDELLDLGRVFAFTPRPAGRRLSILTLSGGAGVLMTDAAADHGLEVAPWTGSWAQDMREVLPAFASVRNPIDLTGALVSDTELLRPALELAVEHPDTDVVMVMLGNMQNQEADACRLIAEVAATTHKPVVTVWVGGTGSAVRRLAEAGLPAFTDPVRAVRAVARLVDHFCEPATSSTPVGGDGDGGSAHAAPAPSSGTTSSALDEVAAKELVRRHGVQTVAERAVHTSAEAAEAAEALGFPVVVKLLSTEVPHKSDHGLVAVGLRDSGSVATTAEEILARAGAMGVADRRLVVQEMVAGETELILGMRRDAIFGPVVVLGVGGVLTELASDVQVRLPPLEERDAISMMDGLQYSELLKGPRGRVPVDRDALTRTILAFGEFVLQEGDALETAELNPLVVDSDGIPVAVDALVVRATTDVP
ncbi:acetate--CoA ligase family protein [Nocardioides sp. zg-1228]|uniref:acetate--CoA ligase family protein n=1 Tax=Nocardioides sp. zg-1228 TaxID=2763008 RepID=UPI0016427648|nr:acetate--CoA ligase [Nocardioides sp. zg-1228]MBC2932090.1 acetate--CoA ligase family protein [Nocardioides sp. zg-1228]QSF57638.1 acetate--CoA ligase family protein [Nocardioides sp. zg-1228]